MNELTVREVEITEELLVDEIVEVVDKDTDGNEDTDEDEDTDTVEDVATVEDIKFDKMGELEDEMTP
jgi:hypothetical protein